MLSSAYRFSSDFVNVFNVMIELCEGCISDIMLKYLSLFGARDFQVISSNYTVILVGKFRFSLNTKCIALQS